MYQSQTAIRAEMEIRSKMCISNTRERNTIGGMLLLKKNKIKPTNKKMHKISGLCLHFINNQTENYGNKEPRYLRSHVLLWETSMWGIF